MIRLVRMEMFRLWSRRLLKLAAAGVLLLITVIVVIDGVHHSKSDAAAFAKFKQEKLAAYDKAKAEFDTHTTDPNFPKDAQFGPSRQEIADHPERGCFSPESCSLRAPSLPYVTRTALGDFGKPVAVICAFAAFLIGASAAGAEWSAGTMQSLLYWEPRRIRVVAGKVAGLIAVIGLLVVAAEALFTVAALIAGQTRGTTAGLTSGVWMSYLLLVSRGLAVAGFAAVLGFSIAFGTRVTAAAVGIAFIYFAILENLLVAWKMWLARYMIGPLLAGWLNNGIKTIDRHGKEFALTGVRSGVTLASYAIVMLVVATLWFRQRDVT